MPGFSRYHTAFAVCLLLFWTTTAMAGRSAPVTEPSTAAIEQRLQNIERLLQNQGLLDMLQQIQRLQQEVSELRGQIEVNSHELASLKERQRKLYNDLDQRLQQLQGGTASASTETPPLETIGPADDALPAAGEATTALTLETIEDDAADTETDTAQSVTGVEEVEGDEEPALETATVDTGEAKPDPLAVQAEYQEAFNLLRDAEYDRAIIAFDKFLSKYPDSQYSDNAQYWMGEAYYVTRRFNDAITEYMKLVSNYPDSQKAPNGLLKIAYSYFEMGQKEEAEKVLKDLINQYPDSSAAADAEKRLQNSAS